MKYLLILGNGFSLDLLGHMDSPQDICLTNLASHGDRLKWPVDKKSSFISFRNTPNLWILGVRPGNSSEQNNRIIENIITCANAYYLKAPSTRSSVSPDKQSIYIKAYTELVVYLKYLFIFLDGKIALTADDLQNWPWAGFFKKIAESSLVEHIDIITFNYDIWLERTLEALQINYCISEISNHKSKFSITKPHGSISFVHKKHLDMSAFDINYSTDYLEGDITDFEVCMQNLETNTAIIPLIPPAGDSKRLSHSWAGKLRDDAIKKAKSLRKGDKVIVCGLSYWHVDRGDIDSILLQINEEADVVFVNPSPPEAFDAVLTSLFRNYEHYISMERLCEGIEHV